MVGYLYDQNVGSKVLGHVCAIFSVYRQPECWAPLRTVRTKPRAPPTFHILKLERIRTVLLRRTCARGVCCNEERRLLEQQIQNLGYSIVLLTLLASSARHRYEILTTQNRKITARIPRHSEQHTNPCPDGEGPMSWCNVGVWQHGVGVTWMWRM
ncbi:hypothetical protein FA13DRAFT_1486865 [Coprinellus micaceus]|uniref:Uncharacterized protein n=1 Tax=Coprinellus micaceus TaxID=71717 RepID=A0A4Y7TK08_COPMI|nr:hypothetical protein FA13DRAFT_1486865 [Coprinellus micaceus]